MRVITGGAGRAAVGRASAARSTCLQLRRRRCLAGGELSLDEVCSLISLAAQRGAKFVSDSTNKVNWASKIRESTCSLWRELALLALASATLTY